MRRISLLLAIGLALATVSGCKVGKDDHHGASYVAMGDSYTAAPGAGTPAKSRGACGRSTNNYPHQLADDLDLALTDVSCSGAPSDAVLHPYDVLGKTTVPPQIDGVRSDTDLVTLGAGFNDFGLSTRVFIRCVLAGIHDPDGTPCTDADTAAGPQGIQAALDDITLRLTTVVEAIMEKAPKARVVLVGYPSIFPEKESCANLGIASGDLPLVRHVVESLNASAKAAAAETGATYLDLVRRTQGHDICADDPWIAGVRAVAGRRALSWHPYEVEQDLVADLLAAVVKEK